MIDLEIHTDDQDTKIACLRYWNRNQNDKFTENVPLLAHEYGMTMPAFIKFVNKHSTAYHKEVVCNECGDRYVYTSRREYKDPYLPIKGHYTCEKCTQAWHEKMCVEENAREEALRSIPYTEFLYKHWTCYILMDTELRYIAASLKK